MQILQIDPSRSDIIKQANIILQLSFGSECAVAFEHQINYALVEGDQVLACCTVAAAQLLFDPEDKYKEHMTLSGERLVKTDFVPVQGEVVYNLARRPGGKYKGFGIELVKRILQERGIVMLSAEHEKLRTYYKANGFIPTNMYDISSDGIAQKVMFKKN